MRLSLAFVVGLGLASIVPVFAWDGYGHWRGRDGDGNDHGDGHGNGNGHGNGHGDGDGHGNGDGDGHHTGYSSSFEDCPTLTSAVVSIIPGTGVTTTTETRRCWTTFTRIDSYDPSGYCQSLNTPPPSCTKGDCRVRQTYTAPCYSMWDTCCLKNPPHSLYTSTIYNMCPSPLPTLPTCSTGCSTVYSMTSSSHCPPTWPTSIVPATSTI